MFNKTLFMKTMIGIVVAIDHFIFRINWFDITNDAWFYLSNLFYFFFLSYLFAIRRNLIFPIDS